MSAAEGSSAPVDFTLAQWRDLPRGLAAAFLAERERWPLWLPVFVGIGIGAYFWLTVEPPLWLGLGLAAAGAAAVAAAARAQRLVVPATAAAAIALGFAAAELQAWAVAAPILQHRLGAVTIEGRIVAVDPLPEGARILVAPRFIDRLDDAHRPARIRVRLRRDAQALLPGDWLRLKAVLLPPPAPAMPGAYDFQRRAFFDKIGAVGYALGTPAVIAAPPDAAPGIWRDAIESLRAAVTHRIRAALPGPTGDIAAALITGETHAIPPADAGAFRDAGLAHILVIAGLHMGMVAGIAF
ncbi:MAG TPA: ComEC/Rec2 family competence protein, partial [Stellaceae bacterium]|nr:ComEC/Rec2 family competence protein [Stellaceae bacterium]